MSIGSSLSCPVGIQTGPLRRPLTFNWRYRAEKEHNYLKRLVKKLFGNGACLYHVLQFITIQSACLRGLSTLLCTFPLWVLLGG